MKLLSCHVENFGKLSGFSYVFEDGLNVLLAENGWGKSTLAAFLKVMFYGFEGENRRNEDGNERLRYKPWGGGTYGGSVTFTKGDRVYRMHRTFGARKKEDVFLLYDDETGLASLDFTDRIGEELFGIDRASFTRTVFWSQQDHMTEATALIQAKIGDITSEQSDLPDYDRAIRQVQKEIDRLSPDRASGQIRKKEARAAILEAESARLPQLRQQLADCSAEHRELVSELAEIRNERQERVASEAARRAAKKASVRTGGPENTETMEEGSADRTVKHRTTETADAMAGMRNRLQAEQDASLRRLEMLRQAHRDTALAGHSEREEYLRIQRKIARDEHYASLALKKRVKALRAITAAALIAAALIFVLVGTDILPLPFLSAGAILLTGGLYAAFQSVQTDSAQNSGLRVASSLFPVDTSALDALREEEEELRTSLQARSRKMKRIRTQLGEEEQTLRSLKTQLRRLSVRTPAEEEIPGIELQYLAEYDRREEECRLRITRVSQQIDDLHRQIRESMDCEEQLAALRGELATLRLQYDTCVRTASFLEEARASFNSRYMNPFLRSFRRHYGMLTGESAQDLQTDADFGITVFSEGLPRDPSLMSEGTRDLISLCRRMAMIDAMYPGEKPFLVLDDPFSNLDDERVKGGMRFLHNASCEYQILYLTCHQSRV